MSPAPGPAVAPGSRRLARLAAATVLTYLVGYGLVLFAHSGTGWVLVMLGGPLLLATGVLAVRQVQRGSEPARDAAPALPPS